MLKGIRGAITVKRDNEELIVAATRKLLEEIIQKNCISQREVISVTFTATKDLTSAYPAKAVRDIGWTETPIMCTQEMHVKNSLPHCIRVLILVQGTEIEEIKHIYFGEAKSLRPDLME